MLSFCPVLPKNGSAFGFTFGAELGVSVRNSRLPLSLKLYLIAFCVVLDSCWFTGSHKLDEVTILKKFGIFCYSIRYPTKPPLIPADPNSV